MRTRTEKEMFDLISGFVEADDRIRVAILNGSRANPNVKKDIFQDYDIACFVTEVESYFIEANVVPFFGETIIVEQPNLGPWPPDDADGSYHNYNMQFLDGNRIDLSFYCIEKLTEHLNDSLSKVLIDKDKLCSHIPPSNESSYYIHEPTEAKYIGCCNAFFFAIGSHIPKTIWRKQLPLVKYYTEGWLRVPVRLMLAWEIGIRTGFDKSVGSGGKYLEEYLEPEKWEKYLSTYAGSDYDKIWDSIVAFYEVFVESAIYVAEKYDFKFPEDTANKVLTFVEHVRELPNDAASIY